MLKVDFTYNGPLFYSQKGASANEFASAPFVKQKKVVINHNLRRIRFLAESVSLEPKPPNILRLNELYFSLNQSGRKM